MGQEATPPVQGGGGPESVSQSSATVSPLLQYQARLTNPSTGQSVADGSYSVVFSLYDAAIGGLPLWTETKNVVVARGLFSTALGDSTPLAQSLFSGQAVWLGIKVGGDLEATPRQAVLPVAYALSLVPGASITGSLASPALRVSNSAGPALYASGPTTLAGNVTINGTLSGGTHTHSGADITSGIVAATYIDAAIARDAEVATLYYNMTTADSRFVNVAGPDTISGNSASPILTVTQNGSGVGGYFTSTTNSGVAGNVGALPAYTPGTSGVLGRSSTRSGVAGVSDSSFGVYAYSRDSIGSFGYSLNSTGVQGNASGSDPAVVANNYGTGPGLSAWSSASHGVAGFSGSGSSDYTHPGGSWWKAGGEFSGPNGMIGAASESNGIGVLAINSITGTALYASKPSGSGSGSALQVANSGTGSAASINNYSSSTADAFSLYNYGTGRAAYFYNSSASTADAFSLYNYGTGDSMNVYAYGTGQSALYVYKADGGNYAGYFYGNVYVNGTLSKAGGSFKIDHPLDPANKYLEHSFVESPDMMNVYNGNITTDANGDATVTLPDYFETLNRDFRYQLTVIGQFAQAIVKDEVKDNRFTIKTDKPNVKVSWQVTGIRQDAWANANRIPVEENKPANEQGTYLYPQGYSQPASKGLDYAHSQAGQTAPLTQAVPLTQTLPMPPTRSVTPPVSGPSTLP